MPSAKPQSNARRGDIQGHRVCLTARARALLRSGWQTTTLQSAPLPAQGLQALVTGGETPKDSQTSRPQCWVKDTTFGRPDPMGCQLSQIFALSHQIPLYLQLPHGTGFPKQNIVAYFVCFAFAVLGIKSRALHMINNCSALNYIFNPKIFL